MIIDGHVHMWLRDHLPDSMVRAYLEPLAILKEDMDWGVDADTVWPDYTVDVPRVMEMLETSKVDKAVTLPIDFNLVEPARIDIHDYNEWVFESCEPYPDKLIPFIGVDPNRESGAIKILDHFTHRYGAIGVKVYPSTGWYPDEERIKTFLDRVNDLGLTVISHAGAAWGSLDEKFSEPRFWAGVLDRYPDTNIVLAHLGGKWRSQVFELCQEYPNCYTDCSALQGWLPSDPDTALTRLKELAIKIPDKVIFGSDFPLFDLSYDSPQWVHFVREQPWADEDVKAKLLGENMRKVLGI